MCVYFMDLRRQCGYGMYVSRGRLGLKDILGLFPNIGLHKSVKSRVGEMIMFERRC